MISKLKPRNFEAFKQHMLETLESACSGEMLEACSKTMAKMLDQYDRLTKLPPWAIRDDWVLTDFEPIEEDGSDGDQFVFTSKDGWYSIEICPQTSCTVVVERMCCEGKELGDDITNLDSGVAYTAWVDVQTDEDNDYIEALIRSAPTIKAAP